MTHYWRRMLGTGRDFVRAALADGVRSALHREGWTEKFHPEFCMERRDGRHVRFSALLQEGVQFHKEVIQPSRGQDDQQVADGIADILVLVSRSGGDEDGTTGPNFVALAVENKQKGAVQNVEHLGVCLMKMKGRTTRRRRRRMNNRDGAGRLGARDLNGYLIAEDIKDSLIWGMWRGNRESRACHPNILSGVQGQRSCPPAPS